MNSQLSLDIRGHQWKLLRSQEMSKYYEEIINIFDIGMILYEDIIGIIIEYIKDYPIELYCNETELMNDNGIAISRSYILYGNYVNIYILFFDTYYNTKELESSLILECMINIRNEIGYHKYRNLEIPEFQDLFEFDMDDYGYFGKLNDGNITQYLSNYCGIRKNTGKGWKTNIGKNKFGYYLESKNDTKKCYIKLTKYEYKCIINELKELNNLLKSI